MPGGASSPGVTPRSRAGLVLRLVLPLLCRTPEYHGSRQDENVLRVVLAGPIGVVHADEGEQRGFAGPGRSHDGEEFAFANF